MHPLWFERGKDGAAVEVYAVDSLLDRKVESGSISYYVKWLGFDDERYHTWEPIQSLLQGGAEVQRKVRDWEASVAQEAASRPHTQPAAAAQSSRRQRSTLPPQQHNTNSTAAARASAPVGCGTAAGVTAPASSRHQAGPASTPLELRYNTRARTRRDQHS
ncbi:hypothetical protein D9Q98_002881 [Chlorella vulgaris]|uniref:Chromo domain-containing protein n=1 Tax=Chlorella vulgaris TaxID=3077 RepID=A0A9D4TUD0_CHLVU|nr:hypothetical protein D9Q98_002881 [Chlorella vulgaris]